MLRSLIHFRRAHLAVALATAVVTAVLGGALLMGDSVRGSLRAMAVAGLGRVDLALESPRFFRQGLADDLAATPAFAASFAAAAPAIRLRGAAVHAESGSRAGNIHVTGVDARFLDMTAAGFRIPGREAGRLPGVVINRRLAEELGATTGEDLVLSFARFSAIPRDTLLGRRAPEDVSGTLRVTVAEVVGDGGAGRFGLTPHQGTPLNLFIDLEALQRRLGVEEKVNSLYLSEADAGDKAADETGEKAVAAATDLLRSVLQAADVQLRLRRHGQILAVESEEFVLRPQMARAVEAAAEEMAVPVRPVQAYLANAMQLGERQVPYSAVAAVGGPAVAPPFAPLLLADGEPAPAPGEDEVLLGAWAARDLAAAVGDKIEVEYYVVGDDERLTTASHDFTVAGVLAGEGLALDPSLTPEYPGIADADSIAEWDPPFPVDLARVRPRDEAYWDAHRAAPKAFFAPGAAARLWGTRYGHLTALRLAGADEARTWEAIRRHLQPEASGFTFLPVRAEALESARGATDFSQLFLGFSFFLLISAALLVSLLFALAVEQRAAEVGLLLALGFPRPRIRRRFLGEALVVAAAGVLGGAVLAVGYAAALLVGLRTIWRPAIGSSDLEMFVSATTLAGAALAGLVITLLTVTLTLRRVARRPAAALLAGRTGPEPGAGRRASRLSAWLAWGGLGLAVGLAVVAVLTGQTSSPGLSFGTGAGLLTAGLAFFARWCRGSRPRGKAGNLTLLGMAMRNSAWSPGRSILSLALVACATFVIVTVAANRHEAGDGGEELPPGTGGFALVAEASVPLYQDLNSAEGRFELGFDRKASAVLDQARIVAFPLRPGSDASCLNLYAPGAPRLLGAPPDLAWRSSFPFQVAMKEVENPWTLLEEDLGEGVIPAIGDANSVQWILHLGLGKDLVLQDESGEPLRLRIVATLDRSLFQSELLISQANLRRFFPSRTGNSYFLVAAASEQREKVAQVLEARLERFGVDAVATGRKLADYQAVENTYLSTFQALGGFGLLLGTLGLGIVLLRNILERLGELATLRAFGFRRRRLARMVLAETSFLLVLGVALGAFAALLAVTPRLLAGQVALPWLSLGRTLGLVIAVGMISCLAAVRSALRAPLLGVLKAER